MIRKIILSITILFLFLPISAQEKLSIEEAIQIAVKNNYDILIAHNDADIARINNTPGNAGMLPSLQLGGSGNYSVADVKRDLASGTSNSYSSSTSTSLNGGAQLSWTLFDGGRMFVTKKKLSEIESLGSIQFRDQVLATVYDVIAAYYDVVRQKQELNSINELINYNRERVTIAQAGYQAGSMIRTDVLQAKIDLNVTMENAINQQFVIDAARKTLNALLGRQADQPVQVSDSIPLNYEPDEDELRKKIFTDNTSILSSQKQIDIAKLSLKELTSVYSPIVNLNAGYNYAYSKNPAGSVVQNRSTGPQIGGSLILPIYNGGQIRRNIKTARLQLQSAEYNMENTKLQVNTELLNALTGFKNQQKLMVIEKENNELNKENIEICLQRLRLGQSTSLELHQAQDSYAQSSTRLINFEYNLKVAEIKLKQLIASLK